MSRSYSDSLNRLNRGPRFTVTKNMQSVWRKRWTLDTPADYHHGPSPSSLHGERGHCGNIRLEVWYREKSPRTEKRCPWLPAFHMIEFSSPSLLIVLWLASLTAGDFCAYGSAFVVLVGVIGESIAELTEWVKPKSRNKKLAISSALLLILGLAGDLVAIHMTQIATASLNQEAGEARKKAGEAEARSKNLESSNKQLAIDLDTAKNNFSVKQSELAREQRKTAKAEEEASKAQLELKKFAEETFRRTRPRILDSALFMAALKDKPKGTAEILYKPGDDESWLFAVQINRWLGIGSNGDGLGWEVSEPRPITEADIIEPFETSAAPLATRAGGEFGLGIVVRFLPDQLELMTGRSIIGALMRGIGAGVIHADPRMQDNVIRIVVGPRMY